LLRAIVAAAAPFATPCRRCFDATRVLIDFDATPSLMPRHFAFHFDAARFMITFFATPLPPLMNVQAR